MKVKIIVDPGSCHGGKLDTAKELVRVAKECGADACKFQLFPDTKQWTENGNIPLPLKFMGELIGYGTDLKIEVFASVFYDEALLKLKECGCESIKFAYSVSASAEKCYGFKRLYASYGVLADIPKKKELIPLYCIPEYPVPYHVNFEGIFPRFKGFSSHCLGIGTDIQAIEQGAEIIEKHFRLDKSVDCPDAKFAIKPKELEMLCKHQ